MYDTRQSHPSFSAVYTEYKNIKLSGEQQIKDFLTEEAINTVSVYF